MKLFPILFFLLSVFTLSAQHHNNELPVATDSKKALENVEKNKRIRNRSKSRISKRSLEQRMDKATLNQNALSYTHKQVRKERKLFTVKKDKYVGSLVVLLDLKGYKSKAKHKAFNIKAGEKIQLLKEKKKKFKIKYAGKTLFVDRQYYLADRDK